MADSDPSPSPPAAAAADSAPLASPPRRDDLRPVRAKVEELDESRLEMVARLQKLRQDIENWRSMMDNQAMTCKDEISELKKRLNTELQQLRLESDTSNISKGSEDQGKESAESAQKPSQDGTKKNRLSDFLRRRMVLHKVQALFTRVT